MQRTTLNITSFLHLLLALVLLAAACSGNQEQKETGKGGVKSEVPPVMITERDGKRKNLQEGEEKIVVVLFQPDCDHCQREAVQIGENLEAFKDYTLYMVSSSEWQEIESFASAYGLPKSERVRYVTATVQDIVGNFGSVPTPSLYIYNGGKLIQSFNGEVAIEVVLKYI